MENLQFAVPCLFGLEGLAADELATAKAVREYCEKINLPIIAYTVGANFLLDDIQGEMKRLKKCVDIAAQLGAPLMRHDVFYELKKQPLYNYRMAIQEIAPYVRELSEYAKSKGVRTCTENHGYIMQDPTRVEELILAVDHENYGWLCDIGNFLCADADPAKSTAIAAAYSSAEQVRAVIFP